MEELGDKVSFVVRVLVATGLVALGALTAMDVGYEFGFKAGQAAAPHPTYGQRIASLHGYMRDPITRWAWRTQYCRKDFYVEK
jgi:hypothetical protein